MPSHKHRALLDEHVQHSSGWAFLYSLFGRGSRELFGRAGFRWSPTGLLMLFFHPSSTSFANSAVTLGRLLTDTFSGPSCRTSVEHCHASPNGSWLDGWQRAFRQSRISKTNAFSKNQAHFCDDSRAVSSRAAIRILRDIVRACARVTQTQMWSKLLRL